MITMMKAAFVALTVALSAASVSEAVVAGDRIQSLPGKSPCFRNNSIKQLLLSSRHIGVMDCKKKKRRSFLFPEQRKNKIPQGRCKG
jgi:hypothetical protein